MDGSGGNRYELLCMDDDASDPLENLVRKKKQKQKNAGGQQSTTTGNSGNKTRKKKNSNWDENEKFIIYNRSKLHIKKKNAYKYKKKLIYIIIG